MTLNRRSFLAASVAAGVAPQAFAQARSTASNAPVIDVHTHMFSERWVQAARASDDPTFRLGENNELLYKGDGMGRVSPAMLDYPSRIKAMDDAGVDIALISLTAPNVYWGSRQQSAATARAINNDFMAAANDYDGRIRWMASLPWQHAEEALEELKSAQSNGAIGVCTLTNIAGLPLTDPSFRPIWREIEARELPVFIHPTKPTEVDSTMAGFGMINTIGFTSETSLCFANMIYSGFLDEFPRLNLIASHGGGTLPYLLGRFDIMWERNNVSDLKDPPSSYARRLWFDSIVYDQASLNYLITQVGFDRVLYGSDYPFRIGDMSKHLAHVDALSPGQRDALRSGNALGLFDLS